MENFIRTYQLKNKSLSDQLIAYHKMNSEYKEPGLTYAGLDKKVKNSMDVVFFNNSHNSIVREYFKEISNFSDISPKGDDSGEVLAGRNHIDLCRYQNRKKDVNTAQNIGNV